MHTITIKRQIPRCTERFETVSQCKNFSFTYNSFDLSDISSPAVINEMKLAFDIARPMYDFMLEAYERMLEQGLIVPEV